MTDAFPARERPDVHSRRVPASGAGIRPATGADDAGSRPGSHLAALEPTAPPPAAAELTAPEPTAPPVTSEPREPEPTAPLPAARTRDPFLDNARGKIGRASCRERVSVRGLCLRRLRRMRETGAVR